MENATDDRLKVVRKWYEKLEFPTRFDTLFEDLLERKRLPDDIVLSRYGELLGADKDAELNFLILLYLCEELEKWYRTQGISEEIFIDTMKDLILWATDYLRESGGVLGIADEVKWLKNYYDGRLFRLGRLEFERSVASEDILGTDIKKGDRYVSVHIPEGKGLSKEACEDSFGRAIEFFKAHFPEHKFKYFSCFTWMFDKQLKEVLSEKSNIIKFCDFFDVVHFEESDEIIRHIFGNGSNRGNIINRPAESSLTKWIIKTVKENGKFYEGYGIRRV